MIPTLRFLRVVAVLALVGTGGCAGGPKPIMLRAMVDVQSAVNPDVRGRPSPVVVRVYALKSLAAFNGAAFFALFGKDKETLGADLVDADELQLMPGEKRSLQKEIPPDARYIAVFAAFRDVEHARWRDAIAVVPQKVFSIQIRLENSEVHIAPEK